MKTGLSVGQLVILLQEFDQSLPVYLEGCDCTGAACGIEKSAEFRTQKVGPWIQEPVLLVRRCA